jgi:CheY-like chemotaxis protein
VTKEEFISKLPASISHNGYGESKLVILHTLNMDKQSLKILYTDDDPDDFVLLQDGLLQIAPQHILYFVQDSRNLITAAKEFHPDLILLDYNMPLCDGAECLKKLKEDPELKVIPVVMYCTSSSDTTLRECLQLGAARYLRKAVNYAGIFKGLHTIFNLYYEGRLIEPEPDHFFIDTCKLN